MDLQNETLLGRICSGPCAALLLFSGNVTVNSQRANVIACESISQCAASRLELVCKKSVYLSSEIKKVYERKYGFLKFYVVRGGVSQIMTG